MHALADLKITYILIFALLKNFPCRYTVTLVKASLDNVYTVCNAHTHMYIQVYVHTYVLT